MGGEGRPPPSASSAATKGGSFAELNNWQFPADPFGKGRM